MTVFASLLAEIGACRRCVERPKGRPLPHPPRPVLQASRTSRLFIAGQAPGVRAHASRRPFTDPSGDRLRDWLGLTPEVFYDKHRIALVPIGFCFPGHDRHGGDLPPRKECAEEWRVRIMAALPAIELVLAVGIYAQRWHLRELADRSLTDTVRRWREMHAATDPPVIPLPHPSWRNNAWLKQNPWFEAELIPTLRTEVGKLVEAVGPAKAA